jgi:hypothetical protein
MDQAANNKEDRRFGFFEKLEAQEYMVRKEKYQSNKRKNICTYLLSVTQDTEEKYTREKTPRWKPKAIQSNRSSQSKII